MSADPSLVKETIPKRLQFQPQLKDAIIKGDADEVKALVELKRLLAEDVNLNGKDEEGYTPMHWAATYGFLDIVKILWEKGANIRAKGGKGDTALWDSLKPVDNPPQRDTPLHNAAWNGHTAVIQFFLSCGMEVDVATFGGHTPLHWAASAGHLQAVKLLVRNGAQVDAKDKADNTAQTLAAQHNHNEICTYLASVPVKDALYSAVVRNNELDIDNLASLGVDINVVMDDGCILLHIPAVSGNIDTLQKLLDKSAQTNAADANGTTALHWAATHGHKEVVKLLLERGADIHAKTNSGSTALHLAALGNHVDAIKVLIEKGADVNAVDNNGSTPFVWAAQKKQKDSMVCLVKLGANVANLEEDLTQRLGREFKNAASQGDIEVIKRLEKYSPVNGENGIALLHDAAKDNKVATLEYLKSEHNINLDGRNLFGQTALHIAVFSQSKEAIEYLLQHGANINAKENMSRTALHWAAIKGYKEIYTILLDKNADPTIQDEQGYTAAQLFVTVKPPISLSQNSSGYFGVPERGSSSTFNSTQRRMLELAQAVLLFGVVAITVVYFAWLIQASFELATEDKANVNKKPYNRL